MLKLVAVFISFALLLYLGACGYLYANQNAYLYYPTPAVDAANAEKLSLESDGETLRIWRIGPAAADALIFFGGNAQDVAHNIPLFRNTFPGRSVYLVNYRGYGGSTGTPSEAGLFKDALTVFDFVQGRHKRVDVIGQSLGSGVAVFLASTRHIGRLMLITPYDSIENVAKGAFPQFPVSLLLKDKYASADRAGTIRTPTLIVLAEHDEVIPRIRSEALISAFRQTSPTVAVVPGATHNSVCLTAPCLQRLNQFLTN